MRVLWAAMLFAVASLAHAGPVFTGGWFGNGPAIKGYDTVAYFTDNAAIKGSPDFQATYDGVQWYFASAKHRDLFTANPEKYRPEYGGFCAYALGAKNEEVKVDPTVFTIVDGRLFLNYSSAVRESWLEKRDAYIRAADKNWPSHQDQ